MSLTRRDVTAGGSALALSTIVGTAAAQISGDRTMTASMILVNGHFATLDRSNPNPEAVAIADGKFIAVGLERDVRALADSKTQIVDLRGRRAIPGLIDSHMHIIRGGLNYNMELRWDGVRSATY